MGDGQRFLKSATATLSAYDALGYLAPGAGLVLFAFLIEAWSKKVPSGHLSGTLHTPVFTALQMFSDQLDGTPWVFPALFFVAVLAVAYIMGHIVASISALTVDRMLVAKGHGYPFEHLFALSQTLPNPTTRPFYRGLFLWLNVYLMLQYASLFYCSPRDLVLACSARAVGIALVVGVLLKVVASIPYGRSDDSLKRFAATRYGRRLIAAASWPITDLFSKPYDLLASTLAGFLRTSSPFPKEFRERYAAAFEKRFGFPAASAETENYWLAYLHIRHAEPAFAEMADNWLRLYGFARNLSTSLYLAFLYGFGSLYLQQQTFIITASYECDVLMLLPVVFFSGSVIMLSRYYYLYANYYTRFIFRSFVYLETSDSSINRDDGTKENGRSS